MGNSLLMSTGAIVGISVAAVIIVLFIIFICVYINLYNSLQRLKNIVDEGWATIEVSLKKRYDLIPNLVETVKGYAKHESQTLEAVIAARHSAMGASGEAKIAAENALTGTLRSLFALQESYPNLKANTNFMDLQNQLKSIETEISAARRYYNGTVKDFNTKIDVFPSNLVAKKMRLTKRQMFEITIAEERNAPKVQF